MKTIFKAFAFSALTAQVSVQAVTSQEKHPLPRVKDIPPLIPVKEFNWTEKNPPEVKTEKPSVRKPED